MSFLDISDLQKHYGRHQALADIDLAIGRGEFVVMVGPSGCGKSTLLRTIAGLEDATSGRIVLDGRDVTHVAPRDRGFAMVFQNYALYPHLTVAENMGFALRLAGSPKAEIAAAVQRAAETLQITDLLAKKPRHLSGGQRQRVAIGRAIVRQPSVFLFDEPLSNLDAALRAQMRVELADLHQRLGTSMIYVTHDQVEAMTMADRIVLMRAGRIEQQGAPLDLYNRPANRFVAGFLGAPRINFVPARILAGGTAELGTGRKMRIPETSLDPGTQVTLGLRPEHFMVGDPAQCSDTFEGRVVLEERLGRETVLHIEAAEMPHDPAEQTHLVLQRNIQSAFRPGDTLRFDFPAEKVLVFAPDGAAVETA